MFKASTGRDRWSPSVTDKYTVANKLDGAMRTNIYRDDLPTGLFTAKLGALAWSRFVVSATVVTVTCALNWSG